MKIAVFTDLFLPHVDGVTNSLVHLIQQYVSMGHEVLVVTPKTKGSKEVELPGVKIIFLPSVPAGIYPEFKVGLLSSKLLLSLRKFSPEIVHITSPGPVGSMGLFYAKIASVKSVATFHGYFMEPEYLRVIGIKNHGVKIAQKILWKYTKAFFDRADMVVTPSEFVKKDLKKHGFSRKITVINNAINFTSINRDENEHLDFVEKYNLQGKKVITYIGRLSIEKNIEFLLKIIDQVVLEVKNAHLLIIGDGPDRERLESLVLELGISDLVTFTGQIKNTDLVKIDVFSVAKVFATASHSEVQPMSIIEAMHFGLPIVAVKSRGLTEMIQDNGYLITAENKKAYAKALVKILSDKKLQNNFVKKSLELSESYSLETSAKKHLELYFNIIENKKNKSFLKRIFN